MISWSPHIHNYIYQDLLLTENKLCSHILCLHRWKNLLENWDFSLERIYTRKCFLLPCEIWKKYNLSQLFHFCLIFFFSFDKFKKQKLSREWFSSQWYDFPLHEDLKMQPCLLKLWVCDVIGNRRFLLATLVPIEF